MPIMGDRNDPRRNGEGYTDLTAYEALRRTNRIPYKKNDKYDYEKMRHSKMIGAILRICELADFQVECKIVLRDKRTGKLWE